jgi:nicotinamide mononucleotide transporter
MGTWFTGHILEIFGAVTGIVYVILEIRRNILLWPLGIATSAVYMVVFGDNGFYSGMVLQGYYVAVSIYGWYSWHRARSKEQGAGFARRSQSLSQSKGGEGGGQEAGSKEQGARSRGQVSTISRIDMGTAVLCLISSVILWAVLWYSLDRWTDSPVPLWDGLITSLSVVATWMLTRKYLEQWYVWIVANSIAVIVYLAIGMYPTAVLFIVYFVMAIIGVRAWRREAEDGIQKTEDGDN